MNPTSRLASSSLEAAVLCQPVGARARAEGLNETDVLFNDDILNATSRLASSGLEVVPSAMEGQPFARAPHESHQPSGVKWFRGRGPQLWKGILPSTDQIFPNEDE